MIMYVVTLRLGVLLLSVMVKKVCVVLLCQCALSLHCFPLYFKSNKHYGRHNNHRVIEYVFFCPFRFKAVASKSKLDLVNEGFTEFTIEDFHNTVSFLY